ncbi:Protein LCHN [Choanephora cucurbitarum]|uniref:Protein LCHN n=1 Tax=Choanephora cucurbitarum TaxID=101091 RepID=A0A1C7NLQ6_9FUNG|nr:Protein LCHN [Choanephora cucurbitarum]
MQSDMPIIKSNLVAIFIVHFDVIRGNVIEWQYPQEVDLEGIEFQAVCSGLHRIESDVIVFSRQPQLIGLSVFENRPSEQERGAQMRAIGVLVKPFDTYDMIVSEHIPFLKRALDQCMDDQLNKDDLIRYFTNYVPIPKPTRQPNVTFSIDKSVHHNLREMISGHSTMSADIVSSYGMDVFTDFLSQFGPNLFVLWKAALLKKRILLIHAPPMELACKYVRLIHLLSQVPVAFENKRIRSMKPMFTVGVNDIPLLGKQKDQGYVACTPDAIFEVKTDLYDLLITLPSSQGHRDRMLNDHPPIIHSAQHNQADRIRYQILCQQPLGQTLQEARWINQLASYWTGVCYFLYDYQPSTSSANRDWQQLFAGRQSNRSEEEGLLSFREDEEQDATEINSASQVFEAVATTASNELHQHEVMNYWTLRSLHGLTECLLTKLKSIIETRQEGETTIHLYPKDMVQLGLDPQLDIDFLTELSLLYFNQPVYIHGLHNSIGHLSDTLCGCCKQQIRI